MKPMQRLIWLCLFFLAVPVFCGHARAQDSGAYAARLETLNVTPPMENPDFFPLSGFKGRNILDSTNTVIGEIDDIYVDGLGMMRAVEVDFDKVGAGRRTLYLDFSILRPGKDAGAYVLPVHRDDLREDARVPAAGVGETPPAGTLSASFLEGKPLRSATGGDLGRIESVLFGGGAHQLIALAVQGVPGAGDKVVAVPFDRGIAIIGGPDVPVVTLAQDKADMLVKN